jgi:cysteine-rich repeat protein
MAEYLESRAAGWRLMAPAIPLVLVVWACGPGTQAEHGEPVCGDGVKAPDELCDDGNQTAGDGCSAECIPSGTELECVPLLEGHWDNRANALLPMPDQTFVVAGELTVGNSTYGWVARYSESGELLWFEQLDGDASVDALTPDGQDGAWALVQNNVSDELRHFNRDGLGGETIDIDASFGTPVAEYAIEYVEGSVWVGGAIQRDFWLGRYDLNTDVASTLVLEDHLGFDDEIRAIGRTADEVVAAATVSTSPNNNGDELLLATTDVLLLHFDLLGNEMGRVLSATDPDSEFIRVAEDVVSGGPGRWLVGGTHASFDVFDVVPRGAWLGQIGPAPVWSWDSHADDAVGVYGGIVAVDGAVALAFGTYIDYSDVKHGEGGVTGFSDNGKISWRQFNTYESYNHYEEQQIVLDHSARVRSVGKAWTREVGSQLQSCVIAW